MNEWREYKLDDVAFVNPTESISKGELAKKVAMDVLQPFTKRVNDFSIEPYNGGMKFRNGDTIVARITPCLENGKTAFIDFLNEDEIGFGSTEYIVLREKENISNKHFLYYFSISPTFREVAILSMTGSSGRQRVQTDVVREHIFLLPPLPEQKAIAGVLSSLDDKIDLLHRQNKTLEAMAETLFRQWFVLSKKKDLKSEKLGDLLLFLKGRKPKSALEVCIDGLIPQILIETFDTGKTLYSDPSNMIIAEDKDILMVMDGASSGRVEIGFNGIVGSTIGLFRPLEKFNYPLFLFYFLKTNEDFVKDNTTGSAIPHADKSLILDLDVEYDLERVKDFEKVASIIFEKKQNNKKQILSLVKLRDTLLQKLMSGEVRVNFEVN